jgi:hypothetical protein
VSGYSETPLVRKLGIAVGGRIAIVDGPPHVRRLLEPLPDGARVIRSETALVDVAWLFVRDRSALDRRLAEQMQRITVDGAIWVSWPKRSSGVKTDIGERDVREHALQLGLVDTKICAVDATWSGLRCCYRVADRPALAARRAAGRRAGDQ